MLYVGGVYLFNTLDASTHYHFGALLVVPAMLFGVAMIYSLTLFRKPDFPPGCCRECGYDLTGNVSGVCPECGTPILTEQW